MAVGLILRLPGKTNADYDAVNAKLGIDPRSGIGDWPAGLLSHAAGEADGALVVMEVWESREAQGRFMEQRLGPAIGQAGVIATPELTWVDLVSFYTPGNVPA